ncbi:MAG: hypothetical protein ACOX81_03425 [Candidatus Heteroscillospira sp.]
MSKFSQENGGVRVCIDRAEKTGASGRVYSRRLTKPVEFSDLGGLALKLDALYDTQNFPQAYQRPRSFGTGRADCDYAAASPEEGMEPDFVKSQRGGLLTFDLYVLTRRSSSWQGFLLWENGLRTEFSSVLDILYQLDERLK